MKNSLKIFVAIMLLITSSISYSEYKVRSDLFVFELPGADAWESGDQYSIKTAWEETGEETCDPWSPEAIDQIMSFTQERTCGVEESREVTVREYNTSFDIYRTVNTFTETQTVGVTRARDVNFSADAWTVAQNLYNCSAWRPDPSTVDFGETFTQTRDCKIDEERNAQLALNTGEVLSSFVESRTVNGQDTRQNTGTFRDWSATESTFTQWTDTGAPSNYGNWTPVVAEQTADFTQSRNYQQTQERFEQKRELDAVTGDIRNVGSPIRHEQVVTETEDRNVVVSNTSWSDVDAPYACTEWSPLASTIDEGTPFTQTRDCQQDQERTWTYALENNTELSTRVEPQTITVTETQNAIGTKENWTTIASTYTNWTNIGGRNYTSAWSPAVASQTTNFTQTRDYDQDQERTREDREQNDFTDEIRVTNTEVETQTISGQESRSVVVTQTAWSNDGAPYACTEWSPKTNTVDEGTSFTQTRDCQQDQERVWNYDSGVTSVGSRIENQTITVQESRNATGTLENWVVISSTYSNWSNAGSRYSYSAWSPEINDQNSTFTQTRSYSQDQERTRTEREQNSYTNEIRNTGTFTETQTVEETESRTVTVNASSWSNTGSVYSCTAWSPSINGQTSDFTQTRDCQQDQVKNFSYVIDGSTVATDTDNQTVTTTQSRVVDVSSSSGGGSGEWSAWSTYANDQNCTTWSPATSTVNQGQSFTQTRTCYDYQERFRYYTIGGQLVDTDRETRTVTDNKSRNATGTKIVKECKYVYNTSSGYFITDNRSFGMIRLQWASDFWFHNTFSMPTESSPVIRNGYNYWAGAKETPTYYEICRKPR